MYCGRTSKRTFKYRFETSLENLEDAKLMFENGRYKNALNRAYYSIFHAIRSVNTLKGFDSSKHSGVIAFFNQSYVKEGVFDKELSKIIKQAYDYREKHHLYVCPQQSKELYRHITFRDFLRSNPEAVKKYGSTKERAAQLYPDNIDKYIEYKSPCIEELYETCGLK